jgi:DNA-binding HxlR family transcriptional regulator
MTRWLDLCTITGVTRQRTYGDRCGIARALDLVGERWAMLVVRELLLGPKRFTDLRGGLPGLSADVLAQRLRELEDAGIVRRAKLPPPSASRVYELTDWGAELEPALLGLGRWVGRAAFPDGDAAFSSDSAVLALKTLFDPAAAGDLDATYELRLGEDRFRVRVTNGRLELQRGEADRPDAVIDSDPATLASALWHRRSVHQATRSGELEIRGSRATARRFLKLFPLRRDGQADAR